MSDIATTPEPVAETPTAETEAPIQVEAMASIDADAPASAEAAVAATQVAAQPAAPALPSISPAECAQQLRALFPALFGGAVKPLKLRIQVDIQERAPGRFSKAVLSAFFRRHTGSTAYLIAVTKAASRFDLDGQPAGELSTEHRQVALDELARRRAGQDERRQLEEQQRRNRAGLLHDHQITTLTRANFCALKGVPEDELDHLLEMARGEADERARHAPPQRPAGFDRVRGAQAAPQDARPRRPR